MALILNAFLFFLKIFLRHLHLKKKFLFICFCSLPVFNDEDRQLVKGTYDFFAISHFSTKLVTHAKEDS